VLTFFIVVMAPQAQANRTFNFNTCKSTFKFYQHDAKPHKAFATSGGVSIASSVPFACGFAAGPLESVAKKLALGECNQRKKELSDKRPCVVIQSK